MEKETKNNAEINELKEQIEFANDVIMGMFFQDCGKWNKETNVTTYFHKFIGAYEAAQEYLLKHGLIFEQENGDPTDKNPKTE